MELARLEQEIKSSQGQQKLSLIDKYTTLAGELDWNLT
jgi:hypothetical protein